MREFELLRHVYGKNRDLASHVTIPPGDDMGAVRIGGAEVLVTVDQVADGIHFKLESTPLAKIARKAIARNLSDVAAMAAQPVGAVVAASLPRNLGEARAKELFDHLRRAAERWNCPLFGGDISMWDHPLLMSVTVLAEPAGVEPVRRSGAKPGDAIFVTGELGGSLENIDSCVHHLDFEPRLELARQLARNPATRPNCMIDLSDGLARDLGHLCRAAGLSAEIHANELPLSAGAYAAAHRDSRPLWRHAVGDGEDYELCFTVSADVADRMPTQIDGVTITRIGSMTQPAADPVVTVRLPMGGTEQLEDGWEHRGA